LESYHPYSKWVHVLSQRMPSFTAENESVDDVTLQLFDKVCIMLLETF